MTNYSKAIGDYRNAVDNFELSVGTMLRDLKEVRVTADRLPVPAHDDAMKRRMSALADAAALGLSANLRERIIPAAKAA